MRFFSKLLFNFFLIKIKKIFVFEIFFRENVSFENPEGTNWLEIDLPINFTASTCSCSQNGNLWVLTFEEKCLVRTDISKDVPYGRSWQIIDPYPNSVFTQITSNLNLVYALDSKGFVYLLNTDNLTWIKVLKDLTNISLSISNKVSCFLLLIFFSNLKFSHI